MTGTSSNSVRLVHGHIPESLILLSVDKEIAADDCEAVEEHLRTCIACRSIAEQYRSTFEQLSEYKRVLVDPGAPLSHSHQLVFEDKLDRLADELKRRRPFSLSSAIARWWPRTDRLLSRAGMLACATLMIVACVAVFHSHMTTVSAKEMLIRSVAFERDSQRGVGDPIIVQKIRIRAGSHQSERTLYRDLRHNRRVHEINGSGEEDRLIDGMLQQASLNADELLMPDLFLRISSENKASTASVKQGGEDTMLLAIHLPGDAIADADLTLRDKDFHAVEARLLLRDLSTVHIAELSYQVVEFGTLRAGLFDLPRRETAPELEAGSPLKPSSDVAGLEIAALSSLHAIHAELGSEIAIDDSDSRIVKVEGVVENAARKQEIETVLRSFPTVEPAIETLAQSRRRLQSEVYDNQGAVSATSAQPLLEKQLKERFPSPEERQEYVRGVLSYGQSASSYVWVLDELSKHFTSARCATLRPKERKDLNNLLLDEANSLSEDLAGLKKQADTVVDLEPQAATGTSNLLRSPHEDDRSPENPDDWQGQVHAIHSALDRVNENLTTLIVGAGERKESSDQLRAETYQLLSRLTVDLQRFRSRLGKP